MDYVDAEKRAEVFKQETACFQNARHENLVFFCGYIMDSGKYGLLMERIRGPSLHALLHDNPISHTLEFNDAVDYAVQICQVSNAIANCSAHTYNIFRRSRIFMHEI